MKKTRLPVPTAAMKLARGGSKRIAEAGARAVAKTTDVRELGEIAHRFTELKKIVAAATGRRIEVNRMAAVVVDAMVKGGRILAKTVGRGNPQRSHSATFTPTLKELGFSKSRSSRWQLAGLLPDKVRDELKQKAFDSDDEIWGPTRVLHAAKTYVIHDRVASYKARAERGAPVVKLTDLIAEGKKFPVIYVDPPWTFHTYSDRGKERSPERHYPVMSLDEIKAEPIGEIAEANCALLIWGVWPEIQGTLDVIKAWGFEYKTAAFVWVKKNKKGPGLFTGMGYWTRSNTEYCLLATRGKPERTAKDVHQVILDPVGNHSTKPALARQRIEQLFIGPYVEGYGRTGTPGWVTWGFEIKKAAE